MSRGDQSNRAERLHGQRARRGHLLAPLATNPPTLLRTSRRSIGGRVGAHLKSAKPDAIASSAMLTRFTRNAGETVNETEPVL